MKSGSWCRVSIPLIFKFTSKAIAWLRCGCVSVKLWEVRQLTGERELVRITHLFAAFHRYAAEGFSYSCLVLRFIF